MGGLLLGMHMGLLPEKYGIQTCNNHGILGQNSVQCHLRLESYLFLVIKTSLLRVISTLLKLTP